MWSSYWGQLYPTAIADLDLTQQLLRRVFDRLLDQRLDLALADVLFNLARYRSEGFYSDDEFLPAGDQTIAKLVRSSFVEFNADLNRYYVASVLSSLFNPLETKE